MSKDIAVSGDDNASFEVQREQAMPGLKLHGQTPISSAAGKRLCAELSPLSESPEESLRTKIDSLIETKFDSLIEKSLAAHIPKFLAELKASIDQSVKSLVEEHFKTYKEEIRKEMENADRHNALRTKCEAETLETYNRRENLRILGAPCSEGYEDNKTTECKVLELAKTIDAEVVSSDISIAHRLPSRRPGSKPIIVRFARRIARINILKNKKKLKDLAGNQIRIFEDLSTARIRFCNLMRADTRINNVWTRDGVIHFIWKEDEKKYTLNNLFEGGLFLGYNIDDVEECFQIN